MISASGSVHLYRPAKFGEGKNDGVFELCAKAGFKGDHDIINFGKLFIMRSCVRTLAGMGVKFPHLDHRHRWA